MQVASTCAVENASRFRGFIAHRVRSHMAASLCVGAHPVRDTTRLTLCNCASTRRHYFAVSEIAHLSTSFSRAHPHVLWKTRGVFAGSSRTGCAPTWQRDGWERTLCATQPTSRCTFAHQRVGITL
jgi:hypothetical protein